MAASLLFAVQLACQQTFIALGKCENIRLSGIAPESAAFDSADLYPAAFRFKSGIRRVRGRTGGRYVAVATTAALFFREYKKLG